MSDGEIEDAGGDDEIGPVESLGVNELLRNTELALAQQSRMEWERYAAAAMVHRHVVEPTVGTEADLRALDPFAQCAARLALAQGLTQRSAELQITRALALRDRLPAVNALLKTGQVAAQHIPDIVSRTELIEGSEYMADIDREIAENLERRGSWSRSRMRDMVDATIFRRDPDLVRNNREDAKKNRGAWGTPAGHGMALLDAHGTPSAPQSPPSRTQPRTAAKHARRQQERLANRRHRELRAQLARELREEDGRNSPPPTYQMFSRPTNLTTPTNAARPRWQRRRGRSAGSSG